MNGIQLVYQEKHVEDLLEENCDDYLGIQFLTRQFRTKVGLNQSADDADVQKCQASVDGEL